MTMKLATPLLPLPPEEVLRCRGRVPTQPERETVIAYCALAGVRFSTYSGGTPGTYWQRHFPEWPAEHGMRTQYRVAVWAMYELGWISLEHKNTLLREDDE